MIDIKLQPTRKFLKSFPEHIGEECLFLGWDRKINDKWGSLQIKVKFGNRRIEFIDVNHFISLTIK